MAQRITTSLQETVRTHPHIANVSFDAAGEHYFQSSMLPADKGGIDDEKSYKQYGKGQYAGMRLIPGPNVDKKKEAFSIGFAGTEIVETISRKDLLAAQAIPDDHSIMAQLLSDPNAKAELGKQLLQDPEFVAAIKAAFAPAEETAPKKK